MRTARIYSIFLISTLFIFIVLLVRFEFVEGEYTTEPDPPPDCGGDNFPSPTADTLDPFTKEELATARQIALDAQNHWRVLHGAPLLTMSDELNEKAQHEAECDIRWGWGTQGKHLKAGFNGWGIRSTNPDAKYSAEKIAVSAVDSWYNAYCQGTKETQGWYGKRGFAKIVWKRHTQIGLGFSRNVFKKEKVAVVFALYSPVAGNYTVWTDEDVGRLSNSLDNIICCRTEKKGDNGMEIGFLQKYLASEKDHGPCFVLPPKAGGGCPGGGGSGSDKKGKTFGGIGVLGVSGTFSTKNGTSTSFWTV